MSREEILKNLNSLHYKILHHSFCNRVREAEVEALVTAKKLLEQPKTDWIPCEERLPSGEEYRKRIDGIWYYQHMLTATNDSDIPMQVGWYNQEDECWYDQDGFVFYPIAWQPLPAPYKKEGAE